MALHALVVARHEHRTDRSFMHLCVGAMKQLKHLACINTLAGWSAIFLAPASRGQSGSRSPTQGPYTPRAQASSPWRLAAASARSQWERATVCVFSLSSLLHQARARRAPRGLLMRASEAPVPVSYTHLTLPTILLV
eukprot:6192756-Pleurochrysis_carterae.AAC.9